MKTQQAQLLNNISTIPAQEAEVVSIQASKAKAMKQRVDALIAFAKERTEERTGIPQPLTKDELIAKFKAESQGVSKTKKTILRADVRTGKIVAMTPEENERFLHGDKAEVVQLKTKR